MFQKCYESKAFESSNIGKICRDPSTNILHPSSGHIHASGNALAIQRVKKRLAMRRLSSVLERPSDENQRDLDCR